MNVLFDEARANVLREKITGLPSQQREAAIIEALVQAIQELGTKYVLPFRFRDEKGSRTSHHLVFATKHERGYRIMKEIMAKRSSEEQQGVASFGYCPAPTIQPLLFELNLPLDDLKGMLQKLFAGQTLTVQEIYNRHNVNHPYTMKNYRDALLEMEEQGLVYADSPGKGRRKGTLPEGVRIMFKQQSMGSGSL